MEWKLQAEKREKGEKISPDYIPAVVYGKGIESQSLKLKKMDFDKVFAATGESNLISLDYGQGGKSVLVKDLQRDVLKHSVSHVDFFQVNMKEKVTAAIRLHFSGESKAVKELGGMLMKEMDELEVECLPGDLIDHLDIDISVLNTFDDMIRVSDLALPKTFRVIGHAPEDVVAMIAEPKAQVEEAAPAVEAKPAEAEKKAE